VVKGLVRDGLTIGQTSARLMVLELGASSTNGLESLLLPKEYF